MSTDLKQTRTITKAINPLVSAVFTKIIQSSLDAHISVQRGVVQTGKRTAARIYSMTTGNCNNIEQTICPIATKTKTKQTKQTKDTSIKTSDLIRIIECRERNDELTEDDYNKLLTILSNKYVIFTKDQFQEAKDNLLTALTAGAIINFILNLTSDSIIDVFEQKNIRKFNDFIGKASEVSDKNTSEFTQGRGSIMTNFIGVSASTLTLTAGHMCYGNLLKRATKAEEEDLTTIQKALEIRTELLIGLDENYDSKIKDEKREYKAAVEDCITKTIEAYRKILIFNVEQSGDTWQQEITIAPNKRFILKKSTSSNEIINNYTSLKDLITNFGVCVEEREIHKGNLKRKLKELKSKKEEEQHQIEMEREKLFEAYETMIKSLQRKKYNFFSRTSPEIQEQNNKELKAIMDLLNTNIKPINPDVANRIYRRLEFIETHENNEQLSRIDRATNLLFGIKGVGSKGGRKSHKKQYKKLLKHKSTYKVRGRNLRNTKWMH